MRTTQPSWAPFLVRMLTPMLILALLAGCGAIQPAPPEPLAPPAPPSHSEAEADRKLALVASERAQAGATFAASEQVCYTKFLVNRCLDSAREQRRAKLAALRAIEIEAEHFKRKASVEQRDRELAEAEKKYAADEARIAAEARAPRALPPEPAPKTGAPVAKREAEHAAKEKQRAAEQKAGAAKRAANVEAYEKRKRDSERRQREVEEKKKAKASEAEGK
jgi:hypothetical protein